MKIAHIDDRQEELDILSEILSRKLNTAGKTEHKIYTYHSGEEFLASWKAGRFDLIILDVFMDGIYGISVAREIRKTDRDVRLVFCSSSNEFAAESYAVKAQYYLHKPYSESQVDEMLTRLELENYELLRAVTLSNGQRVMLRNVLYTEYSNHLLVIHCKHGNDIHSWITQAEAEAALCEYPYFLVCSKGIIVNLYEVESQVNDTFRLTDGTSIPISRRKAKEVQAAYTDFRFEKMRREVFF